MGAVELTGEGLEPPERDNVIVEGPGGTQAPAQGGPVALGEVVADVAFLVADAPLHHRPLTEHGADRLA